MKKNSVRFAWLALSVSAMLVSCSESTVNDEEVVSRRALVCVEQMIDGCINISGEVGSAKIGDPYSLMKEGKETEALYAVESWYSWHSIEDYANNIRSIRNTYYGSLDGSVATYSLCRLMKEKNPQLDVKVCDAISGAVTAIESIPAPFRNHIDSPEAEAAMEACDVLSQCLEDLKGYLGRDMAVNTDALLAPIVTNYVDAVVLPTYLALKEKNNRLYQQVVAFKNNPSDDAFKQCAEAWLEAREPWETSEAFLFGPVDALGLDPNMDSWPLDQAAIIEILTSGKFDNMNWNEGDSEDAIERAQSVRGFHSLEFLIFKDGKARSINGGSNQGDDFANYDYTAQNAAAWGNYMVQIATLLAQDATDLYNAWSNSFEGGSGYAEQFKSFNIR